MSMNKSEEMVANLVKMSEKSSFDDLKQGFTGVFETIANSLIVNKI